MIKLRSIIRKNNSSVVSLIAIVSISSMVCAAYGWVGQYCNTLIEEVKKCGNDEEVRGCIVREHPNGVCNWGGKVCFQLDIPNNQPQVYVVTRYGDCVDGDYGRTYCNLDMTPGGVIQAFWDYPNCS